MNLGKYMDLVESIALKIESDFEDIITDNMNDIDLNELDIDPDKIEEEYAQTMLTKFDNDVMAKVREKIMSNYKWNKET